MTILYSLLIKTSSLRNISILFVASHLVLLLMWIFTLPVINNQIGTQVFDIQTFGYNVSEAASIVDTLNNETRALYLFPQLTLLDLLYPFFLALFLSSLLFRLCHITESNIRPLLLVLPFMAMIFDYAENICVILMISKALEITKTLVLLSSSFTVLKGVLTSIGWIAILFHALKWLRIEILERNKKRTKSPYSKSAGNKP